MKGDNSTEQALAVKGEGKTLSLSLVQASSCITCFSPSYQITIFSAVWRIRPAAFRVWGQAKQFSTALRHNIKHLSLQKEVCFDAFERKAKSLQIGNFTRLVKKKNPLLMLIHKNVDLRSGEIRNYSI